MDPGVLLQQPFGFINPQPGEELIETLPRFLINHLRDMVGGLMDVARQSGQRSHVVFVISCIHLGSYTGHDGIFLFIRQRRFLVFGRREFQERMRAVKKP